MSLVIYVSSSACRFACGAIVKALYIVGFVEIAKSCLLPYMLLIACWNFLSSERLRESFIYLNLPQVLRFGFKDIEDSCSYDIEILASCMASRTQGEKVLLSRNRNNF